MNYWHKKKYTFNTCRFPAMLFAIILICNFNLHAQNQINLTHGSYLVLKGNAALVSNNVSLNNNGTIIPGNSTLYFIGNGDTSLSNITGTGITNCNNLTINKSNYGVAIKSNINITGALSMNSGNLYADNHLILISDSNTTARVAPVTSGCNIYGNAIVQRYVPGLRSWRLLTAPVTNS